MIVPYRPINQGSDSDLHDFMPVSTAYSALYFRSTQQNTVLFEKLAPLYPDQY